MYPSFLIELGAYIRWIFTGFKKNKYHLFFKDDKLTEVKNFFASMITLALIYLLIVFIIKS